MGAPVQSVKTLSATLAFCYSLALVSAHNLLAFLVFRKRCCSKVLGNSMPNLWQFAVFHTGTNTISFLEHMLNLQVKSRLMINILCNNKFGCVDFLLQMWFFQIQQLLPWGRTILTLTENSPTFSSFVGYWSKSCSLKMVREGSCLVMFLQLANLRKILILVYFTESIHLFCNDIVCQLCNLPPNKIYSIQPSILNRLCIGSVKNISIDIKTLCHYMASCHLNPSNY